MGEKSMILDVVIRGPIENEMNFEEFFGKALYK